VHARGARRDTLPQYQSYRICPAIELILDDKGHAAGAVLVNLETNEITIVKAKAVVMATGGIGRLHVQGFPTTNHYGATADGLVMVYRAGCPLVDIDTMQYHPTCAAYPIAILGQLVTEKVRGVGAQVVNIDGEQFAHPLEPRDMLAACIIRNAPSARKESRPPRDRSAYGLTRRASTCSTERAQWRRSFPLWCASSSASASISPKSRCLYIPASTIRTGASR